MEQLTEQRKNLITGATGKTGVHEFRIEKAGQSIYVKDYPGAAPAMVMVHGFPDNHRIYDELAPILSERGQRVITFDFLGFGDSEKSGTFQYSFDQQESDLAAVADALHLKSFIPVAHDAGGPAVINYARKHQDRVSAIVLLNTYYADTPTLKLPQLIRLSSTGWLKPAAEAVMSNTTLRNWLLSYQANQFVADAPEKIRTKLKSSLLPMIEDNFEKLDSIRGFNLMTGDLNKNVEENRKAVDQLASLEMPVTLIWGEGDPFLNVGVAKDLAKQFKHAELHLLPLNHWPQVDDPKAVADILLPFRTSSQQSDAQIPSSPRAKRSGISNRTREPAR
ncbi:alpha/beta fold hydrolase [Paraburkholderia sp. EG304]|uniref:alpha/beta fold hydrolase n=1 Tax=Paraburkholderia sp. EG304 TaxID=3237015 RepID=UPI00397B3B47